MWQAQALFFTRPAEDKVQTILTKEKKNVSSGHVMSKKTKPQLYRGGAFSAYHTRRLQRYNGTVPSSSEQGISSVEVDSIWRHASYGRGGIFGPKIND